MAQRAAQTVIIGLRPKKNLALRPEHSPTMHLPLNALRAFEVSARHLSFTRAGLELNVSQAAVSQHVKQLEERLKVPLFRRLPRGLTLTDEGQALLPVLAQSFERMVQVLDQFGDGRAREALTVGVVGTFAVGWLIPRLRDFQLRHPFVDFPVHQQQPS